MKVKLTWTYFNDIPSYKMKKISIFSCFIFLLEMGCTSRFSVNQGSTENLSSFSWVQLGPDSQVIARVATLESACPFLVMDGVKAPMAKRGLPSEKFPAQICELQVPPLTRVVEWNHVKLPLPQANLKKILVLGDTGCRIKVSPSGLRIQDCSNPQLWPFLKVSEQASKWKPDLVIHVGDYLYRESPCPNGMKDCAQSPWGDRWATWRADFFDPARSLLETVPWVFIRGNHESCERSGEGWFRLLDPRPYLKTCQEVSEPYSFEINQTRMMVLDTVKALDESAPDTDVHLLVSHLKKIDRSYKKNWIWSHHPFWGLIGNWDKANPNKKNLMLNQTLQEAARKAPLPSNVQWVISGHIHLFEALSFTDKGPSQLVIGNGGTELSEAPQDLSGIQIAGRSIESGVVRREFGFTFLEAISPGYWKGVSYGIEGNILQECWMKDSEMKCHGPAHPVNESRSQGIN